MDTHRLDHGEGREEQEVSEQLAQPGRPLSAATKQETLFVFDWDDTILPTSWLERIHALTGGPLRPEVQRQMAGLCVVAAQTLSLAQSMGTVVIITNSAPGWVDQSCQLFMPQIAQQVRGYQICSKPMHAPLTFKITAFRREVRQFRNVISIGDGDAERAASLRLQVPERKGMGGADQMDANRRVKSVKLIELPTCQQLVAEHEMLQIRLPDVAAYPGSLDLKARFPTNGFATPANGSKAQGCTLVHFSRPLPGPAPVVASQASAPGRLQEDSGKMQGLVSLRALQPGLAGLRSGLTGVQLPPLGRLHAGSPTDVDSTPSRCRSDIGAVLGQGDRGDRGDRGERGDRGAAQGQGGSAPGEHGEGVDAATAAALAAQAALDTSRDRADVAQGRVPVSAGSLWKVQNVGDGRGNRLYPTPGKKRPILVPGLARGGNSVWREHSAPAATRGF